MKKSYIIIGLIFGLFYLAFEVFLTAIAGTGAAMTGLPYAALMGKSSIYMFLLGAIIGLLLGMFNENPKIRKSCNVFFQCLLGAIIITVFELITGLILNVWLGFHIWSYNSMPLNLLGQICLPASILWFSLTPLVFWLDDTIRYYLFNEGNKYNLFSVYKDLFKITKKTSYQD